MIINECFEWDVIPTSTRLSHQCKPYCYITTPLRPFSLQLSQILINTN